MKSKTPLCVVCVAIVVSLSIILGLSACKSDEEKSVISAHKMEAILYDYHLAQGLAQMKPGDALIMLKYQTAILEKHGVSQAQFDASMAWYMRHTEQMHNIYERLSNRLSDEAVAQGSSLSEISQEGALAAGGDTANVWKGQKAIVLNPYPPFNRMDYAVKADTTFHAGDRVALEFTTQFIYQDGIRNAVVMLALQLANDSIATRIIRANSSSHYSIDLTDENRIGNKAVKGFFLLPPSSDDTASKTTLRMALFTDIRLIRMHTAPKSMATESTESTTQPSFLPPHPSSAKGTPTHTAPEGVSIGSREGKAIVAPLGGERRSTHSSIIPHPSSAEGTPHPSSKTRRLAPERRIINP